MGRGAITEEINKIAMRSIGREITKTELRLYAYIDYVMKNEQKLDPRRCNQDDRDVLSILKKEGHIEGGASGLAITKEFYDYMAEVLWEGYVVGGATYFSCNNKSLEGLL